MNLNEYTHYEIQNSNKKVKIRLMAKDPRCYWCGIKVMDYKLKNIKRGEEYPADGATIDHLYDKFDLENRYKIYKHGENKVLACYQCNQRRAKQSNDRYKQEHERRSKTGKLRKPGVPRPLFFLEQSQTEGEQL